MSIAIIYCTTRILRCTIVTMHYTTAKVRCIIPIVQRTFAVLRRTIATISRKIQQRQRIVFFLNKFDFSNFNIPIISNLDSNKQTN